MTNDFLTTILSNTYTLSQLKHRISVLKDYLQETIFGSAKKTDLPNEDSLWLNSIPKEILEKFTKDNTYEIFTRIEKEVGQIKTLTMYLTFEPDSNTLTQIGTRAKTLFPVLLDIKYDPNLIAGTALVWNGVYKDYSLHSKIVQKNNEILESFKKFLR